MVQVMSSPSADMRATPRRRAGDDQATFLSRWLKVWVILLTVGGLVVVGYLIVITNSLASINGNLATAQRAVVGAGGNVVTLPNQVDRINGALAGIDPALKPIPGQADEIIAALTSINSKLTNVDSSLTDTDAILKTVLGTVARTAPAKRVLEGQAWSPRIAIRRRADGGYTVAHGHSFLHPLTPATFRFTPKFFRAFLQGRDSMRLGLGREFFHALAQPRRWILDAPSPFERERVLDPAPEPAVLGQMQEALRQWHPEIAAAPFVESWGGMIEASPDVLPIISAVDGLAVFYVATGFSGHGFGMGPGAGRLVADMVSGQAEPAVLRAFRLGRYFDGSPIRPGPAV